MVTAITLEGRSGRGSVSTGWSASPTSRQPHGWPTD